jgi:hypothetical protein
VGCSALGLAWWPEQGQNTERLTRGIDQLGATDDDGNPRLDIRLGGIYALERIDKESHERPYQSTVMEVLTAYVRENAPWPHKSSKSPEVGFIRPPGGGSVSDSASDETAEQDKGTEHDTEPAQRTRAPASTRSSNRERSCSGWRAPGGFSPCSCFRPRSTRSWGRSSFSGASCCPRWKACSDAGVGWRTAYSSLFITFTSLGDTELCSHRSFVHLPGLSLQEHVDVHHPPLRSERVLRLLGTRGRVGAGLELPRIRSRRSSQNQPSGQLAE